MAWGNYSYRGGHYDNHGIVGRSSDGKKRVFDTNMCIHVWAQQNQHEGRNGKGSVYFRDNVLYSYDSSFPIGVFTTRNTPDGKRIVLISEEHESQTTSDHQRTASRAVDMPDVYIVRAHLQPMRLAARGEYDEAFALIVSELVANLKATAKVYKNTRKQFRIWNDAACEMQTRTGEQLAELIDDYEIVTARHMLGVEAPAHDLEAMRQEIRDVWAEWEKGEPKRKKARDARARKSCVEKFVKLYNGIDLQYLPYNFTRKIREVIDQIIELRPDYAPIAMEKYGQYLFKKEIDETFDVQHPAASSVVYNRRLGEHRGITINEWLKGKNGGISWQEYASSHYATRRTLMRKRNGRLETTMGVEVPWKQAVACFLIAKDCYHNMMDFVPTKTVNIGHFTLSGIDSYGNLRAGCHFLHFEDMVSLAALEEPETVKDLQPRYPVPAVCQDA